MVSQGNEPNMQVSVSSQGLPPSSSSPFLASTLQAWLACLFPTSADIKAFCHQILWELAFLFGGMSRAT